MKEDVSSSAYDIATKEIDYDSLSKLTRAQFEEFKAAQKSERQIVRQSPEFQTVSRDNRLLQNAYLDIKEGHDGNYRPKHTFGQQSITRNLTINVKKKVFGRSPASTTPACIVGEE